MIWLLYRNLLGLHRIHYILLQRSFLEASALCLTALTPMGIPPSAGSATSLGPSKMILELDIRMPAGSGFEGDPVRKAEVGAVVAAGQ